jgi:hypothetical protein
VYAGCLQSVFAYLPVFSGWLSSYVSEVLIGDPIVLHDNVLRHSSAVDLCISLGGSGIQTIQ